MKNTEPTEADMRRAREWWEGDQQGLPDGHAYAFALGAKRERERLRAEEFRGVDLLKCFRIDDDGRGDSHWIAAPDAATARGVFIGAMLRKRRLPDFSSVIVLELTPDEARSHLLFDEFFGELGGPNPTILNMWEATIDQGRQSAYIAGSEYAP